MIVIKTVNDYIDDLCKMYPTIDRNDIKRICQYGWKSLYLLNSYGGDVLIDTKKLWCYFGNLTYDSLKHFNYYVRKLCLKFRVLYNRRKIKWDGYYYFSLTETQYQKYTEQIHKRGRKRKWFTFNKVFLYKMLDECLVKQHAHKYIFKTTLPIELGFVVYKKEFITDNVELLITRPPQKFEDILITNNNYSLL